MKFIILWNIVLKVTCLIFYLAYEVPTTCPVS